MPQPLSLFRVLEALEFERQQHLRAVARLGRLLERLRAGANQERKDHHHAARRKD